MERPFQGQLPSTTQDGQGHCHFFYFFLLGFGCAGSSLGPHCDPWASLHMSQAGFSCGLESAQAQ